MKKTFLSVLVKSGSVIDLNLLMLSELLTGISIETLSHKFPYVRGNELKPSGPTRTSRA